MQRLHVVLSLTTKDNDYQRENAAAAEQAAAGLGVNLEVIYAENDAITQSQQLLEVIQSKPESRPHAILLEPVGTSLEKVATAAVSANIAWVVLNREAAYLSNLRDRATVPVFSVTTDHTEVGRIQGRQLSRLLPQGGGILYVEGPASSSSTVQRYQGMMETKPNNIEARRLSGQWTQESAYRAAQSLMRLTTSKNIKIDAVCSQNDFMAVGIQKAFRDGGWQWSGIPFTGVDGLRATGLKWVNDGTLAATVVLPTLADIALRLAHDAIQNRKQPPEITFTEAQSYPALEKINPRASV